MLKKTTLPVLSFLFLAVGLMVLSSVWYLQYGLGYKPCHLCYFQRYPWWLIISIGLFGYLLHFLRFSSAGVRNIILTLGLGTMLFSMGLAAYHAGVEWHWWRGPNTCTGVNLLEPLAQSVDDFFKSGNIVSCETPALIFLGLSLSGWNFIVSLVVFFYISFLLFAAKR